MDNKALIYENKAQWSMMRPNALKGNDRIGPMKLFIAFSTKALPKDRPTDRPTDGHTVLKRCKNAPKKVEPLVVRKRLHVSPFVGLTVGSPLSWLMQSFWPLWSE